MVGVGCVANPEWNAGVGRPGPAFMIIVVLMSSLDVTMIEFVRKSLLGSSARDIEIHRWSCILRVSSDGRWSKTEAGFEKVPYCFINPGPSASDLYFQLVSDMYGASSDPTPLIMHTSVICGIVDDSSRHIWSRITPADVHFSRAPSKRRQMPV